MNSTQHQEPDLTGMIETDKKLKPDMKINLIEIDIPLASMIVFIFKLGIATMLALIPLSILALIVYGLIWALLNMK